MWIFQNPHLKVSFGNVGLNIELKKILNGGNLALEIIEIQR
jgi:hypothetical protein